MLEEWKYLENVGHQRNKLQQILKIKWSENGRKILPHFFKAQYSLLSVLEWYLWSSQL